MSTIDPSKNPENQLNELIKGFQSGKRVGIKGREFIAVDKDNGQATKFDKLVGEINTFIKENKGKLDPNKVEQLREVIKNRKEALGLRELGFSGFLLQFAPSSTKELLKSRQRELEGIRKNFKQTAQKVGLITQDKISEVGTHYGTLPKPSAPPPSNPPEKTTTAQTSAPTPSPSPNASSPPPPTNAPPSGAAMPPSLPATPSPVTNAPTPPPPPGAPRPPGAPPAPGQLGAKKPAMLTLIEPKAPQFDQKNFKGKTREEIESQLKEIDAYVGIKVITTESGRKVARLDNTKSNTLASMLHVYNFHIKAYNDLNDLIAATRAEKEAATDEKQALLKVQANLNKCLSSDTFSLNGYIKIEGKASGKTDIIYSDEAFESLPASRKTSLTVPIPKNLKRFFPGRETYSLQKISDRRQALEGLIKIEEEKVQLADEGNPSDSREPGLNKLEQEKRKREQMMTLDLYDEEKKAVISQVKASELEKFKNTKESLANDWARAYTARLEYLASLDAPNTSKTITTPSTQEVQSETTKMDTKDTLEIMMNPKGWLKNFQDTR